jgi:predicted double-glycine peptidase
MILYLRAPLGFILFLRLQSVRSIITLIIHFFPARNPFFKNKKPISAFRKNGDSRFINPCLKMGPIKKWSILLCLAISFPALSEIRPVKSLIEMRRDKVIVQQWDLSCGAAALTTLLNYQHNDLVTEKEVANALMRRAEYIKNPRLVNIRQGFSLLDLKRYAEERGYKGVGYGRLALDDLLKKAPIIVPVNIFGYNHFVVFRGLYGNRVLLADPAWGNRTMLVDQFERIRIDFPKIGKVGFTISRRNGSEPYNRLAPKPSEFVMTR